MARRPVVLLALAGLMALVTACTSTPHLKETPKPSPSNTASAQVAPNAAAELVTSSMTVQVPAGAVAGKLTATSTEDSNAPSPTSSFSQDYAAALTPVDGRPVVQVDLAGEQPLKPLTVRFKTPTPPSDDAVLVMSSEHDGVPYLLAVRDAGNGYSEAEVAQLSPLLPAWLSKSKVAELTVNFVNGAVRGISRPVGDKKAYEACTNDTVEMGDGTTVKAVPNADNAAGLPLALCLEKAGSSLRVKIASNDTLPWHGAVGAGDVFGLWEPDSDLPDVDGAISNVMFRMARKSEYGEGMVMPFETTSWLVDLPKNTTGGVWMQVDNRAWSVSMVAFAAAFVAGVFTGGISEDAKGLDRLIKVSQDGSEGLNCLTKVMNGLGKLADGTATGTAEQVQSIVGPSVECGPILLEEAGIVASVSPLVSLIMLAITGGSTIVVGGLVGAWRELAGKEMGWQLTREVAASSFGSLAGRYTNPNTEENVTVSAKGVMTVSGEPYRCGDDNPNAPDNSCQAQGVFKLMPATGGKEFHGTYSKSAVLDVDSNKPANGGNIDLSELYSPKDTVDVSKSANGSLSVYRTYHSPAGDDHGITSYCPVDKVIVANCL